MGKTIFAAIVAAVLSSIATTLILGSFQTEQRAAEAEQRRHDAETAKVERERLERRLSEIEKRPAAPPRPDRRAAPDDSATAAAPPPGPGAIAPDGTPYVSRAEMETYAKTQGVRMALESGNQQVWKPTPPKTLEEIARDLGLSAGEEASVRDVLRAAEEELVHDLFGDRSLDEIKRDVAEAKEDPDKQSVLMQSMIQNGFANIGRITTLEARTKKKVNAVLGAERGEKFLAAPRKPVLGPELEEFLKGKF